MAEPPSTTTTTTTTDSQYWCYHCDKRVSIETIPDIICFECKHGFVESISPAASAAPPSNRNQENSFSNQFLQILRLIAEAARDEDNPPPPPPPPPIPASDPGDFLRIELNGWNNNQLNDDQEEEEEEEEEEEDEPDETGLGLTNNDEIAAEEEEDVRRRRRDQLRLRIRDFATRATSSRNRILDWSEILMGLEDHTMEFRVEMPEWDGYVGNPEDYVDAAGYEALLQNLAESDGARIGAPPASKAAVAALKDGVITAEEGSLSCAICKEVITVGEMAKKMPCGHGYHGDCIVTWLGSRNSCPICRSELPTEDPDYEEQRQKRSSSTGTGTGSTSAGA